MDHGPLYITAHEEGKLRNETDREEKGGQPGEFRVLEAEGKTLSQGGQTK